MARPHPSTWLPLLDHALSPEVEIGIAFRPSGISREKFREMLYTARKNANDPKYDALIMFLPAGDCSDQIFVCKKEVPLDEAS